jgi:hypothetical protein
VPRRVTWVVPLALAVAMAVVVLIVGRVEPSSSPASRRGLTCSSQPPARTAVGERAGFAEGASIGGRQGATLRAELAGIAATGARYLRIDVDWSYVGRDRGNPDWSVVDRIVDAAQVCGLEVLGVLAYTPPWARPPGTSDHHPPGDPAAFAAFAGSAVERFGPRGVRNWEVWNEPNLGLFWSPQPEPASYAALLAPTYDAIKAVDPGAVVITGGLSPAPNAADGSAIAPVTFLEAVYRAGGGGRFDAVGHHPSNYPFLPMRKVDHYNDNAFARVTPKLHDVMAAHGDGDKKIWATEMGAPTVRGNSPQYVADYLTQAYEAWNRWPFTGPLIWYSYLDSGTDPSDVEQNFGLVRADFTSKEPALTAFSRAMRG